MTTLGFAANTHSDASTEERLAILERRFDDLLEWLRVQTVTAEANGKTMRSAIDRIRRSDDPAAALSAEMDEWRAELERERLKKMRFTCINCSRTFAGSYIRRHVRKCAAEVVA